MDLKVLLLVHLVLISGVASFKWIPPSLPNGATVTACRGQTVSLTWSYFTESSEQVVDIDWFFLRKDHRQIVLASYDSEHFLVNHKTTKQLSFLQNAGLRLSNVTSEDGGQYTVEVNLNVTGSLVSHYQNVTVTISDPPVLAGDTLRVSHVAGRQLSCGVFTSRGTPPVHVVFTTPCKTTYNATSYSDGNFTFTLPSPVTGGDYTCHIADSPASRCLSNDTALLRNASTPVYSFSPQARLELWKRLFGDMQGLKDCGDVQKFSNVSGVFTIYVNNTPMDVYCDMDTDGGGWTVIQRRQDGSVNFTRHYTEFEAGFGNVSGEFWLGLRHMHELTSQAEYEVRVDMEDFELNTTHAVYNTFSLAGATDNYRLRLGPLVTGPSASNNHMSYNNGCQFSALGNDNSGHNCVESRRGTAWWFSICAYVNPNGVYAYRYNTGTPEEAEGTIIWDSFRSKYYSLKRIEMKVRKRVR